MSATARIIAEVTVSHEIEWHLAFALVGWYLMTAPFPLSGPSKFRIDPDAPLSHWSIYEGFDSASQCTLTLARMVLQLRQKYGKHGEATGRWLAFAEERTLNDQDDVPD